MSGIVSLKKISKGYRQRTGLAQALIGDPEVLILDEPTIGLDPKQIKDIRNLIKSLAGERTIILSTHILPEVSMTCQRVVIINNGAVVAEDTPANLSARLVGAPKVRLRVDGPPAEIKPALEKVPGVRSVLLSENGDDFLVEVEEKDRPALVRAVVESGWPLYEMTPLTVSLEDVFLNLVTSEEELSGV